MATIQKRGNSYRIRASCGYTASGKQIEKTKTWKPTPDMTARQIEKELDRQAVLFDEEAQGLSQGANIKFQLFAEQWFKDYAEKNLRPRTLAMMHGLETRTYAAIGHLRIDRINAMQIQSFINNLAEKGIREDVKYVTAVDLPAYIKECGLDHAKLAAMSGVSTKTISTACQKHKVAPASAEALCKALNAKLSALFEKCDNGGGLSSKTQSHYLTFISDVLAYAGRMDLLTDNPARRVRVQKAEHPEKEIYTVEEAEQFLELMQSESLSFQCFFLLAIYGGFRREELLGFEWSDMDFQNHVVTVSRASLYTKTLGVFTDVPKTKNSHRSMKLPECIFPTLQQYKIEQAERRLKLGDKWVNSDRLFTTWDGRPQHPSCMPKTLKRFCDKNGLRYLGIHSFRHLNASLLITSGVDVRTVSASLGHSQTSTTLDIYSHTFEAVQAQAANAVADALPFKNTKKA